MQRGNLLNQIIVVKQTLKKQNKWHHKLLQEEENHKNHKNPHTILPVRTFPLFCIILHTLIKTC